MLETQQAANFSPERPAKFSHCYHALTGDPSYILAQTPLIPHMLKPTRPTILLLQPIRAIKELARRTLLTLGRVRTIKERNMSVPDILEPVDLVDVFEETQRNRMHGCVAPALVKEATCTIEVLEVSFVGWRAPELHVGDFEVGPEVAGAVTVGNFVVFGAPFTIGDPAHGVVFGKVFVVGGEEFDGFGPEGGDGLGRVVNVDGKAVGLVVVAHVAENVVVDVAVEVDMRLDTPIVLHVLECRMVVEQTAVPPAHLVVGFHAGILNVLLFQDLCALFEQVSVDP